MAAHLAHIGMVDERHIALRADHDVPAGAALREGRHAPAVEQHDALLAFFKRLTQQTVQREAEYAAIARLAFLTHVYQRHRWQARRLSIATCATRCLSRYRRMKDPLRQGKVAKRARPREMIRHEIGSGAAEDADRVTEAGKFTGHIARVIAG